MEWFWKVIIQFEEKDFDIVIIFVNLDCNEFVKKGYNN